MLSVFAKLSARKRYISIFF